MIRKITLLITASCFIFNSCTTDIEINTPGLQATINGELFRPEIRRAIIHDDGSLVIIGQSGKESISFTTSSTDLGSYKLGQQLINIASFEENDTKFLSEEGISNGQIVITEIFDNQVSGNFNFQNLKSSSGTSMDLQNGWFYRLPIENFVPEPEPESQPEPEIIIEEEMEEEIINPCLLNASLTARINGVALVTDNHDAVPFGVNNPAILIRATDINEEITIVFPIDVPVGTHSLTGAGEFSATYSLDNDKASAVSGTLTVTSHDMETNCISGNFEFITTTGITVTEGQFEYGY